MAKLTAFELLSQPSDQEGDRALATDVVAISGSDPTLRTWVLRELTKDQDAVEIEGESAEWPKLREELATASLFDLGAKRTIVVRDADDFLKKYRQDLEKHIARNQSASRLVLDLESLPANTRVHKAIAKDHLIVVCESTTDAKTGVTAASRRKFLMNYVASRHQTRLSSRAADLLVNLIGTDIGMLDTEIAKLALYLSPGQQIEESLVQEVVTGWQGKSVWQINDAIAEGNAAEALRHLDKLMTGGGRPIALFPQVAWSLRRLALATAVVEHRERCGRSWQLEEALAMAGVHRPGDAKRSAAQLRAIGRDRAKQLLGWLLDADLKLKGTHSQPDRDRLLIEHLVVKLAKKD